MRKKISAIMLLVLVSGVAQAIAAPQDGPSCRLVRNAGTSDRFDLILSDGDETVVSGTFTKSQIEVFRHLLIEAKKFALSEEEVGKQEPKTTRFASESEPALVVDVSKLDDQSQIFFTLTTEVGQLTVQAGIVQRHTHQEQGIYLDLLARIQALLTAHAPAK